MPVIIILVLLDIALVALSVDKKDKKKKKRNTSYKYWNGRNKTVIIQSQFDWLYRKSEKIYRKIILTNKYLEINIVKYVQDLHTKKRNHNNGKSN